MKGLRLLKDTIITKKHRGLIIEIKRWLDDENQRNVRISHTLARNCSKPFSDLKAACTANEGDCDKEFVASRCWLIVSNLRQIYMILSCKVKQRLTM